VTLLKRLKGFLSMGENYEDALNTYLDSLEQRILELQAKIADNALRIRDLEDRIVEATADVMVADIENYLSEQD
jgi:hypothetical protein